MQNSFEEVIVNGIPLYSATVLYGNYSSDLICKGHIYVTLYA